MSAIAELAGQKTDYLSEAPAKWRQFTLRRTGRKGVKFSGTQLVEAVGAGDLAQMWYDLSLYRSDAGQIIVELIARRRHMDEQDLCRVEIFDALDSASAWLESYPCANDVPVPAALVDGAAPMVSTVLQAVQLRQRIARIGDEFHSLLSDVFEVLDVTEAVPENDDASQV
jgi:hypothetical protein